ncbi:MAG: hypothetical protein AAFN11_14250 [Chloroflexota bacterium]
MASIQATTLAMHRYAEAYEKLYNRRPRDLRAVDDNWVIVNGARMPVTELELLTHQLILEPLNQATHQVTFVISGLLMFNL